MQASVIDAWPWYVAGPMIGLFVPVLLLLGNKLFGISGNLRHLCAAVVPSRTEYFRYDWRRVGGWNLAFAVGIIIGGTIFGLGWSLIGACPGPLLALVGGGVSVFIVAIAFAMIGTWIYGVLRPRLPH